jgi:hypothetical protein
MIVCVHRQGRTPPGGKKMRAVFPECFPRGRSAAEERVDALLFCRARGSCADLALLPAPWHFLAKSMAIGRHAVSIGSKMINVLVREANSSFVELAR